VRRAPSHSLLGPALLLYLVADGSAAQGQLDSIGALIALCAGVLSLTPALVARSAEVAGARRVGWLGMLAACALVGLAAPAAVSSVAEIAHALAVAACAGLLLDLALSVPDGLGSPRQTRWARAACHALAALVACVGLLSLAPAVSLLGQPWLLPAWSSAAPDVYLAFAVVVAFGLRALRRRLGSSPEALASNAWAMLGLLPAVLAAFAAGVLALIGSGGELPAVRAGLCVAAGALVFGQARMLDPSRRLGVGPATRNAAAAVLTLASVAAAGAWLIPLWPDGALALGAAAAVAMLLALALYRALCEVARVLLAPASGRLLLALEQAHGELADARELLDVARIALGAARRASGSVFAEPYLYLLDPQCELRLDAAGVAHAAPRGPSLEIVRALRERPGQIVLRAPLEAQIVRTPAQRPLLEALCALDAACVLPLAQYGELEGALIMPRGQRRSSLTLEEIEALHRFARHLSGFVCVLAAQARAERRAALAFAASAAAIAERTRAQDELERTESELRALRSGGALERLQSPLVAYSEPMRELLRRLRSAARSDAPLLLLCERGIASAPLARLVHVESGRPEPFVVGECASVRAEQGANALLGAGAGAPGWLKLAASGTLLLVDLPALAPAAQRALVAALRARSAQPALGGEPYACGARLIASCRRDPDELVAQGALVPELRELLTSVLRVPPLRERTEDVSSLVLLALAQSARVLGKPPVGLEPAAQARLLSYAWPGNDEELQAAIELAVARCKGPRVALSDLPLLGPGGEAEHPLDGTLERVERRVLQHALERTDGNKSEAARLLGLPRTTFLDKLRRHGLDEPGKSRSTPPAPN
jgi:DNA-binding NtrC family response regulator